MALGTELHPLGHEASRDAGAVTPTTATTNRELASQAAASIRHPLSLVLLTLTFTTGLIDATSYLGLGHVFTANMTGNVVLLGFGIAGSGGLPIVSPLVSMAAFLVGAGAGGLLASRIADRHLIHIGSALGIEVLLIGAAVVFAATANIRPNAVSGDLIVALLALAMGVRNATVRRIAVPDLTTTVLTMTLTGLAADSRHIGGSGKGTTRRVSAVAAMLTGAIAGALLLKTSIALPLAVAASLALSTGIAYLRTPRSKP
jgi:uncharacterized membrane protein YoaK (UPF0700 family)